MNLNGIFVRNLEAPAEPWYGELADFSVEVVPFALGALEMRARKYIWASADDWKRGRRLIRELQVGLLMGGIDRLVIELRALRGGSYPAENWRDPSADPSAIGLSTIENIVLETTKVADNVVIANQKLDEIKAILEAANTDNVAIEDVLNLILMALA